MLKEKRVKRIGLPIIVFCLAVLACGVFALHSGAETYKVKPYSDFARNVKVNDYITIVGWDAIYYDSGDTGICIISDTKYMNDYLETPYFVIKAVKPGTVMFELEDEFYDTIYFKLTISPVDINDCVITGLYNKVYTGTPQKQNLKITYEGEAVTYKAVYSEDITSIGMHYVDITGTGNYCGTKRLYYSIAIQQAAFKNFAQTASAIKVNLQPLPDNVFYQLQAKKAGDSFVTYNLKSNTSKLFSGLKAGTKMAFRARTYTVIDGKVVFGDWSAVEVRGAGISITKCKITGIVNKVYNGKNQAQSVKVTYGGKPVTCKVTYDNNKAIGLRSVTITGTGAFVDSVTKYYYILPATTQFTGVLEKYNEDTDAFDQIALVYKAVAGGVSGYQIGVKTTNSGWKYYTTTGNKYLLRNVAENHMYYLCVRAYKNIGNGKVVYGKWSAVERAYPTDQELHNNYVYYSNKTISGYINTAFKGQKVVITVGGKSYTVVVTKDAKIYKFSVKVGSLSAGANINFKLNNKFNQNLINYNDVVYYSDSVRVGYSQWQVKLVPGFRYPTTVHQSTYGDSWYYEWNDGSYGWIYFDVYGKVESWSMYD